MGDVDIADQIRGGYQIDKWMRKYKWWHSIFWWGLQVLMVNSYVMYKHHMEQNKLKAMSHYDFHKDIAKGFISGEASSSGTKRKSDNNDSSSTASKASTTSSITTSPGKRN